jgi:hypothetical protein
MKVKTPSYIREGRNLHSVDSEMDAFGRLTFRIVRTQYYDSVSKAKKASGELQAGSPGSGVVRTMESVNKGV